MRNKLISRVICNTVLKQKERKRRKNKSPYKNPFHKKIRVHSWKKPNRERKNNFFSSQIGVNFPSLCKIPTILAGAASLVAKPPKARRESFPSDL